MSVASYEGTVKNGRIRLADGVSLPENATVYVLVPGPENVAVPRIRSPRLADPSKLPDFQKQIAAGNSDAGL